MTSKLRNPVLVSILTLSLSLSASAETWTERPEWRAFFSEAAVKGTVAVFDERSGERWVLDLARAQERFVPASTFKIPHLLFALESGVVKDEFEVFRWDGTPHPIKAWNQDHTLRSSMRHSVVWVYQHFARSLGEAREREYLQRIGYGNADPTGALETFWLSGPLKISALEQIHFLRRLHRNELPFRLEHQRLVKDIVIVEAGRDWILRAKTGWQARLDPQVGWWVGWVEQPQGAVFFALNIEMPGKDADIAKREAIGRRVLESLGTLPAKSLPEVKPR